MKYNKLNTLIYLLLFFAVTVSAAPATTDTTNNSKQTQIDLLEKQIVFLEKQIKEQATANANHYIEMEKRLEVKSKNLNDDWTFSNIVLSIAGIFVTFIGICVPVILYFVGQSWIKNANKELQQEKDNITNIKNEAEESLRVEKESIEEFKEEAEKRLTEIEEHRKRSKEITESLRSMLSNDPTESQKAGDIENAKEIAKDEKSSPFEKAWANALIDYFSQNYKEAIEKLHKLLANYPAKINFEDLAHIYHRLSYCYSQLKDFNNTLLYAESTVILNPNLSVAWYNRGLALYNLEKYDEALKCYDKAIEINPKDDLAWYGKGFTFENMKDYKEALDCYNKALEINPNNDMAWTGKGTALGNMKENEKALECYDKAIDINPKDDITWNNKGATLEDMGENKKALNCYNKALEINPNNEVAQRNKELAEKKLNEKQ